jgi:hypothetical protein
MSRESRFAKQQTCGAKRTRVKAILSLVAVGFLAVSFALVNSAQARRHHGADLTRTAPRNFRLPNATRAQLDPGIKIIYQYNAASREKVIAGEIYVPPYEPGTTNYVEHWVLFANYIYPGRDATLMTTIEVSPKRYESEADFFARVPWGPGFRYVRGDCTDTDSLPGR